MAEPQVTVLDVQNEVKQVVGTNGNRSGRYTMAIDGDISAGNVELGYLTDPNDTGTFILLTDGSFASAGAFEFSWGGTIHARATGATPNINLRVVGVQ